MSTELANPPPGPSQVPDLVLDLITKRKYQNFLTENEETALQLFRRTANYVAAAMIFLHSDQLIDRPVTFDDIKPRLLGHWGKPAQKK